MSPVAPPDSRTIRFPLSSTRRSPSGDRAAYRSVDESLPTRIYKWSETALRETSSKRSEWLHFAPPPHWRLPLLLSIVTISILYCFLSFQSDVQVPFSKSGADYAKVYTQYFSTVSRRKNSIHPQSQNRARVLESFSNPYGYISTIEVNREGIFNPSILVLPDSVGVDQRVFVARGGESFEIIDGDDTRWQHVYAGFLYPRTVGRIGLPYLTTEADLTSMDLPAERKMPFKRCEDIIFDQFVGPEDPRLFFTSDGQPLMIYSQTGQSPMVCRAMFVIDARMVIPRLSEILKNGGLDPPIVFKDQTPLVRDGQTNIEKNWAPFPGENGELFFHVSLIPQMIYKYVEGVSLQPLVSNTQAKNCVSDIVDMEYVKFHHATPLLRVTLCNRGECVPNAHNTVLFGMIHMKFEPEPYMWYQRRIVTWNTTAPYEYVSVSKPLSYSGTDQRRPVFTTSFAWTNPQHSGEGLGLNHGFLDDVVVASFGIQDEKSAYMDILAKDLLSDHSLCSERK